MAWSKTSRHLRGYGSEWSKLRLVILERDCYLCQSCKRNGLVTTANTVDHIVSKANKGSDNENNLQSLCAPCHNKKTLEETGKKLLLKIAINADGWPV